jgi:hypothetical protein
MGVNEKLIEAAIKLVEAAHKELDAAMPERLAGIVKLHAALGIAAAWIPIPGVDLAAGIAAIWGMYYRINHELELPFGENIVKSVASGVGTNLAAYFGVVTVAQILKFIPGLGRRWCYRFVRRRIRLDACVRLYIHASSYANIGEKESWRSCYRCRLQECR